MHRERVGSGMEFKYRAVDDEAARQPPLPPSSYRYFNEQAYKAVDGEAVRQPPFPPSSYSYFTEQAIRAGYMGPSRGRVPENFQNPVYTREAIQRELEKERIREEIIATEIARRRALEAEVRREMMLERELAMRGRGNGFDRFSFLSGAGMRFEPRDPSFGRVEGRSVEERIAMSLEERLGMVARHDIGGLEIVPFQERSVEPEIGGSEVIPFQQRAAEPKTAEVPICDVGEEKEKIVFRV